MSWLKIDDVAKETGLTKRTIRYYEELGLIPAPERSQGGVRLYTKDDVEWLKKIVDAKEVLGFSLQEIQKFLQISEGIEIYRHGYRTAEDELSRVKELKLLSESLTKQLQMIEVKMQKIEAFKKDIEGLLSRVQEALSNKK